MEYLHPYIHMLNIWLLGIFLVVSQVFFSFLFCAQKKITFCLAFISHNENGNGTTKIGAGGVSAVFNFVFWFIKHLLMDESSFLCFVNIV